ncbi:hypothetical protein V6N13_145614 [Hibiscus sabdariffa]|uniref:Uncharacterized protein n=1 Tax=Hibiscus sabdariffa TaxID=183260 RepID=A0ABR2TQ50_9ROSI
MSSIVDTIHVYRGFMSLVHIRSLRSALIAKEAVRAGQRTFAAGASKAKKGSKGPGSQRCTESIDTSRRSRVDGSNWCKHTDSVYPDWLRHLLDNRPALRGPY